MLIRSLPIKSRKRLARDVLFTCTTDTDLVHDVKDRDCLKHYGTFKAVFFFFFSATFKHVLLLFCLLMRFLSVSSTNFKQIK